MAGLAKIKAKNPRDSSGNMVFIPKVDDSGEIHFGDGTRDCDVEIFMGSVSTYVLFDKGNGQMIFEGMPARFGDDDSLLFGDASAGDIQISWNGTNLQSGPPTGFWAGCPSLVDPNPAAAYFFFEDFIDIPLDAANEPTLGWKWWEDAGATFAEAAGGVGGIKLMSTVTASDKACGIQLGHAGTETYIEYVKDSGKRSWVEFRVQSHVSTNNVNMFIGLAEEGANADNFINDDGNDFADNDLVGFNIFEADGEAIDMSHQKAGGVLVDVGVGIADHTDTMHTYGLKFDGAQTVSFWVDGVSKGTADLDTATFPTDEELSPIWYLKNGAADMTASIDWVKMVVERG